MMQIKNVLVPTDFGKTSEAALNYGRELARTFGARLHLLHVTDSVNARFPLEGTVFIPPGLQKDIEDAAQARLNALVREDDRRELNANAVIRTASAAAETIVEYADEVGADVIVIGTHGRRAVAHLLLGSVAERVVRLASCPVLTVRNPERDFLVPDALVAVARS